MTQSAYTPEVAEKFCAAIAEGNRSIRAICKLKGMPSKATVFRWMRAHPEFLEMYELAKDEQAETFIDEVVEIADRCKANKESVQKAKLQIYARIEAAQKMKPKKYGAKLQHMGEGGGPITSKVTVEYVGVGDEDQDRQGV